MRGFFLLVALRAVLPWALDLGLVECGAFFAGVFLPAFGARVVIVSDLAIAIMCSQWSPRPESWIF